MAAAIDASAGTRALWDHAKGELWIFGRRHIAIDAQALCEHLDQLAGPRVAEVIMHSHEYRLGREDAERIRGGNPELTIQQVVDQLISAEMLSGVGVTRLEIAGTHQSFSYEISNPCVKSTEGAAKAFIVSYWCGVLSYLFGQEYKASDLEYDDKHNVLRSRIVVRYGP